MTNAHFNRFQRGENINITRGKKFRYVINKLYYYDPARPSGFWTLPKLRLATAGQKKKKESVDVIRAWLEKQDAFTLHIPVRKRFARSPYTVTNVMDVREYDLLDYRPMRNTMIIIDTFFR